MNYYNENDKRAAAWLRELMWDDLIPLGEVDERSIEDVRAGELVGYDQCHFFAGIGGWPLALRLAGWPDTRPVWTGSCPCQPFSTGGKGKGFADERHLWPAWHWLIQQCQPKRIFGEQVARGAGKKWLDLVFTDLEGSGYACAAANLPAASAGYPHMRERLYWLAKTSNDSSSRWERQRAYKGEPRPEFEGLVQRALQNATPSGPYQLCDDGISGSMGLLRGYGNAIVPALAAAFIQASED